MALRLLEFHREETEGGNCANCGEDKHADDKAIWLAEYDTPPIVEPFSLCYSCIEKLPKKEEQ